MSLTTFLNAMPGAIAQGMIWGIMAIGVYITYKVLDIADLSVDGSICTGGAVCAMMMLAGFPAWVAMLAALAAGMLCGLATGIFHVFMGIPAILAGILTQLSLYSVNLKIMGQANQGLSPRNYPVMVSMQFLKRANPFENTIVVVILFVLVLIAVLYWFFGTELGCSIRATGNNEHMARAQGINTNRNKIIGLVLSNGIVAFAGALLTQYQGFADVNMGRGAIVIGLAAVIIGEVIGGAVLGKYLNFMGRLAFVVVGGVIYYMVLQIVYWLKLPTDDSKLFTAIIVALFLAVPYLKGKYFTKSSYKKEASRHA